MRLLAILLLAVTFGCSRDPVARPVQQKVAIESEGPSAAPKPQTRPQQENVFGGVPGGRRGNDFTYKIPRPQRPDDPVLSPTLPPVLIKRVEPELTEEARKARISGFVVLEIVIERDGRVGGGRVLKPLPAGLTQKAIDAVQKWEYEPAVHEGLPVRTKEIVKIAFRPE